MLTNPTLKSYVTDEYKHAMRHSKRVKMLKVALPAMSIFIVICFFAASYLRTLLPETVSITSATIEDGKLVMNGPVLAGQDSNNRPYRLTASRALQNIDNPDVITLKQIAADIAISSDETASISAPLGIYDQASEFLSLSEPFNIETSSGMSAQFISADINIKDGMFKTDQPVKITTNEAVISAERMILSDNGTQIRFEEKVRMTIDPKALKSNQTTTDNGS